MRILILMAQYHPVMNPNVFRWSAVAREWTAQGHEVHVVCASHPSSETKELLDGVMVHRSGYSSLMEWAYHFFPVRHRRHEAGTPYQAPSGLRRLLERLMDYTWRKWYWPDGSCLWISAARRKSLELLAEGPFDALISVGTPFSAHWTARACKRRYPDLTWLMDIEDPFCYAREFPSNNYLRYSQRNEIAERQAFNLADAVVLTNRNAKERYAALFPEAIEKMQIIPPISALPPPDVQGHLQLEPGKIHIGYFGSFYRYIRSPMRFLQLLDYALAENPEWKNKIRVHFYGYIEPEFHQVFRKFPELTPNLVFHGMCSRADASLAMRSMDWLLHIGNLTSYHLSSKSVEYLSSGKPILNIAGSEQDSFREIAGDYTGLLHLFLKEETHLEPAAQRMLASFAEFRDGHFFDIKPYTVEAVAKAYGQLLAG